MKPGRELDALMAEKVMGLPKECTLVGKGILDDPMRLEPERAAWRVKSPLDKHWDRWSPDGADRIVVCPPYSTEISVAWEIVEKIGFKGFSMSCGISGWYAAWPEHGAVSPACETPEMAICLAALKAVGHPVEA